MPDYEIRISCYGRGYTHLEILHLNDSAAVCAAEILAAGRPFEVWRGPRRIYGPPVLPTAPDVLRLH